MGDDLHQVNEHSGTSDAEFINSPTIQKPYVGMVFDSLEEAGTYYADYARQEGFWTRIRSSDKTKNRSNEIISRLYVCSHEGKNVIKDSSNDEEAQSGEKKKRVCSTLKSGCLACFRVKFDKYTFKWNATIFNDVHNHKQVTPCKRMKMSSNRHMPKVVKDLTEAFHRENMNVGKISNIFGGSSLGFDRRDCYNHLRNVRHRELEMGDAQSVLNFCRRKQAENPQFYYSMQCDENGRVANFFWVDPRSRISYKYFGDVVSFDTTYRTNKYDMPFAPFTGVNHHFQSIQFGCALLQDETEETFVWLFGTWLEAMGGCPPTSIITDQDLAMKAAIAKVLPTSKHRLCLWHIQKKFAEKLSHVYFKKSGFKKAMKRCIYNTYTEEDFEDQWNHMIIEYQLEDNGWLQNLYEIRASWVPVYNRTTFFAGMNTTGRSEGINSFFDDFVSSKTNLREFVLKYDQALKRIVERENDEDFQSEHKYRQVRPNELLLRHAAEVYTRIIFKKFKDEWDKLHFYKVEVADQLNEYHSFNVVHKDDDYCEHFLVQMNLDNLVGTCGCKHFEFRVLVQFFVVPEMEVP